MIIVPLTLCIHHTNTCKHTHTQVKSVILTHTHPYLHTVLFAIIPIKQLTKVIWLEYAEPDYFWQKQNKPEAEKATFLFTKKSYYPFDKTTTNTCQLSKSNHINTRLYSACVHLCKYMLLWSDEETNPPEWLFCPHKPLSAEPIGTQYERPWTNETIACGKTANQMTACVETRPEAKATEQWQQMPPSIYTNRIL